MVRIASVRLREIRLPLKDPFVISSGVQELRRILLLEVRDPDGRTGWSECVAQELPNYSPETIDTAWFALKEWLIPILREETIQHPRDIFPALDQRVRGHTMAKAAIEMAAWDLEARRLDISLAQLLGGSNKQIPVGISIGIQPRPEHLVQKIRTSLDQGYRRIKIKIKPGSDRVSLEAVRSAFGERLPLSVDANASYTLRDLTLLRSLDEFQLQMIEQPLRQGDLLRHAELQRQIRTPICLDESITSIESTEDMLQLGSGRIVNVKPGRVGGFAQSIAIHDLCGERGIPVWCGGMLESGVGRAHNVALASLENFRLPGDLSPSTRYWEKDIVTPEWTMNQDGFVDVPFDRPGIGVIVDVDRIDDLTHRHESC